MDRKEGTSDAVDRTIQGVQEPSAPKQLLRDFKLKQEQRAQTYSEMNVFFKSYLKDRDVKRYQTLCKGLTQKFKSIGEEILIIEKNLQQTKKHWAKLIRRIQDGEQTKLQLV